jgi:serine O-acetyltransferase
MNSELKEIIKEDKEYYYGGPFLHLYRWITHNPVYQMGRYVILCRKAGYYRLHHDTLIEKALFVIYARKKNLLGERLNVEFGPSEFGRRLKIYHGNIVVNAGAVIGDDCELYGNNCIGNKGTDYPALYAPVLGNHVSVGVGSKIIGKVKICDNVKISSMSLVNGDINEDGGIYGGIPAKPRIRRAQII